MQTEPYNSKSDERLTKIPKTVTNVNITTQTLFNKHKKKAVCTSLLFIVLFIKSHILFLHILLVCTSYCFALFFIILHILLFISFFIYIYALVWCYFYIIFYSLHCPLSGPDLTYISLLIIPCIIYYVTNKETLTLNIIVHTLTNIKLMGPYCQVLGLLHRISRIDIKTHEYISCMFK